jgi:hypothetical protein
MDFIKEDLIKNKFFNVFIEKMQEMSNIFTNKTELLKNKYQEIINSNKNTIKSEIIVQDKFLEYNDNIDNIVKNLDKNIKNAENFITGKRLKYYFNNFFI